MSLQSYIEKLSSKPDHIRRRYSFLISFCITAVIFIFWISSLGADKNSSNNNLTSVVHNIDTPNQSLVASVGTFLVDVKDIFFGSKKVEFTSVGVQPGRK
jgi:cellobiose-specific phosphotransferase system component IIC